MVREHGALRIKRVLTILFDKNIYKMCGPYYLLIFAFFKLDHEEL